METLRPGSTGPLVELLQSILQKMTFYGGEIDGVFGYYTKNAVMRFQEAYGLIADGIAGRTTWNALSPYVNGYEVHTIAGGDTLFAIARRFSATINGIIAANPGINVYNLRIGQKIIVPFDAVVPTDISYSYTILEMNIRALEMVYPFLETGSIGHSALCKKIPYVKIGNGAKEVFFNASFHANEWITTPVLMKFIENYASAYVNQQSIYGHDAKTMYQNTSIYIVPMVNPDGVDLITGAVQAGSADYARAEAIAAQYPSIPFPQGWKANANGIDLNLQFPANWEQARDIKFAQGFTGPAPRDYVGPAPLAAAEALAVYRFTLAHNFRLALAYHTQGRVIFWQYLDYLPQHSYSIGRQFAHSSGYALEQTPYASSFAGYKDWFIQESDRPGYTIEAGIGINPLPISQFETIYAENEGVLVLGAVLAP